MHKEPRDVSDLVVTSSSDIFADLGLETSREAMLKVSIAMAISNNVKKRDLTQIETAKILGVDQAKVSKVLRGKLKEFSVERLLNFLLCLGHDVNINISPRKRGDRLGKIKVIAA